MIFILSADLIYYLAHQTLLTSSSPTSWFIQICNLCLMYQLPHPLHLLKDPPTKDVFKKLMKSKVIDYWEVKLRSEASFLSSLPYFKPQFLSLSSPHKLLVSAGHKSYEVAKARIQLLFVSSQYTTCVKYVG